MNIAVCLGADQKPHAGNIDPIGQEYSKIIQQLQDWQNSKKVEELEKIRRSILNFGARNDINNEAGLVKIRNAKLTLLLLFFDNIDGHLDPNFDPQDVPQRNIAPPVSNGIVYDSGISPDVIKDPKVKRQYEEAIKKNSLKAENYRFQSGLRRLRTNWLNDIVIYINENYSNTVEDAKEVNSIIDKNISMGKSKEELKKSLEKLKKEKE